MNRTLTPLIEQRADPFIYRHDGGYYFIASVPAYDRLELRYASTIAGLADADPVTIWEKETIGPLSELIWAPELHRHQGSWYVYFAAAPSREIRDGLFQHRMYCIATSASDPLNAEWSHPQRIETGIDSFCLDGTAFHHRDELYYVWAQKEPGIPGNTNLYIARMAAADTLESAPVRISIPEFEWETRGFMVNEGPAVLIRHGRILLTYSASATDENYCMGLLWADEDADLLDPASWKKAQHPVFTSDAERSVFGPGHNSFTIAEDGVTDMLVYHARTYTEITGDPLWDPNRHTYVKPIAWDKDGFPRFGRPSLVKEPTDEDGNQHQ
ncbi:family 43 glycosylhydrolase [Halomonas huangheensis]|uniref:Alpha-N-arabinofuranosidase n=1 Tax=Halomonas huangheensis TaxID=1178482 RepID=W1N114_9GAMM|nr:glycoside hydrolase family 43 protein [Halomonas huangheensis]ALM52401.1 alpha-N-arabinofuranosidase [Halomonas huangheensis]ERL49189.1 alpha-N-arabinofuranosidase [Halomonas huangheensis]